MTRPLTLLLALLLLALMTALASGCGDDDSKQQDPKKPRASASEDEPSSAERAEAGRVTAGSKPGAGAGPGAGVETSGGVDAGAPLVLCPGIDGAEQAYAQATTCVEAARLLAGFDADSGTSSALAASGWTCAEGGESGGVVEYRCQPKGSAGPKAIGIQVQRS